MTELTREQALSNLLAAVQSGKYNFQEWEALKQSAEIVIKALKELDAYGITKSHKELSKAHSDIKEN